MLRKITVLCLAMCLLLAAVPAQAQEGRVLRLFTEEDFLTFAENCRLDRYSRGLTVLLCADLDLTGTDFEGIPIFAGTFEGNGYTVSGFVLETAGSNQGFFRYLAEGAMVRKLNLQGTVQPEGSACYCGGLAGSNSGLVEACSFTGQVSGADRIGGLVGVNTLTGVIRESSAAGSVHGSHFVGGIAGENAGTVRSSQNHAAVNTTVEQNSISVEDITIGSITDTESAATVTDIGGVCGAGTGVIRDCSNHGAVGYPKVGYNIGGIAGRFSGYIAACKNYGTISGRKEIGGIVGHLEPATSILFQEDTLQKLQAQMDGMANTAGSTGASIQSGTSALGVQMELLQQQAQDAQAAIGQLIPDTPGDPLPDPDAILAAQNALSSSLTQMGQTLGNMADIGGDTLGSVKGQLDSLSSQMHAVGQTVDRASENLGGKITDISELDTPEDTAAKVVDCVNHGSICGDWNTGGIAGAIGLENDLNPESDVQITGDTSMYFDMELRAVIRDCGNEAAVQGQKQNCGGIVGWMAMGFVAECVHNGTVEAQTADRVGGIAGCSLGSLRGCSAKGAVSGAVSVGGIAGVGTRVSACRAFVRITAAQEQAGAVLGTAQPDALLSENYYLAEDRDPGGVDGISYATAAEAADAQTFFALDGVPEDFGMVIVRFCQADGSVEELTLPYGSILDADQFPALPQKEDARGAWEGTASVGDALLFDCSFNAVYYPYLRVLESTVTDRGLPVLLAQGAFPEDRSLEAAPLAMEGSLCAWTLTLPQSTQAIKLRCLLPQGYTADRVSLRIQVDGQWQQVSFENVGSYLVFSAPADMQALCLEQLPAEFPLWAVLGAAAVVAVTATVLLTRWAKKKKK